MDIPFPQLSMEEQCRRKLHLNALKRAISDMQETQSADARNFADMEQAILNQAFRGEL